MRIKWHYPGYLALSSSHCRLFSITLLKSLSLGLDWDDFTESLRRVDASDETSPTFSALCWAETDSLLFSDSSMLLPSCWYLQKSPPTTRASPYGKRAAASSNRFLETRLSGLKVHITALTPQLSYDLFLPSPSLSFTTWELVFTSAAAMSLIRGLVSTLYHLPKIYKWFYRPYYLLSLLMTLAFPLVRRCPGLCEHLPSQREDNNSCAFDWVSAAAQRQPSGNCHAHIKIFYYSITLLQLNNTLHLHEQKGNMVPLTCLYAVLSVPVNKTFYSLQ